MEALRLVSMFLVIIIHLEFLVIGFPSSIDILTSPSNAFIRIFFSQFSISCVNVFILLSGWFKIKPSLKSFTSLIFQVIFIQLCLFGLESYNLHHTILSKNILLALIPGRQYWFVTSYILLYIIAPILNSFINLSTKKDKELILISFFLFEFSYGWIERLENFAWGYSTISFIGLYLLGNYLHEHITMRIKSASFFLLYIICVFLTSLLPILSVNAFGIDYIGLRNISYISPFTLLLSIVFFLAFVTLRYQNRNINLMATSCLSIYLIHIHPFVWEKVSNILLIIYLKHTGIVCILFELLAIFTIFIVCIIFDQPRRILWTMIEYFIWQNKNVTQYPPKTTDKD